MIQVVAKQVLPFGSVLHQLASARIHADALDGVAVDQDDELLVRSGIRAERIVQLAFYG